MKWRRCCANKDEYVKILETGHIGEICKDAGDCAHKRAIRQCAETRHIK